ncbi:MAG: Gfo/Idh/MocA family oxidoreductase [Gemmatimonadota bacterium]|nr:Gfo/Idh/MocA family oxidoreductase [Gemmatimonadota bacterium]
MERINLGLVGCGGMGTRHLYGLRTLAQTPFNRIDLRALCDINPENAKMAAAEAEKQLGVKPEVFTDLETMAAAMPELDAVDVVTDPAVHHEVACKALDLGLHVMVEKPMAITVRACRLMIQAADRNGRVLSVAENYRRDPSARLVHHVVSVGTIGTPYLGLFHAVSEGDRIFITPWRHLKNRGGPLVDMGVHYADLIRYQLGDIHEVYGDVRLVEPVRRKADTTWRPYEFYQRQYEEMASEVPADAEDSSVALFRMAGGATVSWVVGLGGYGACSTQLILGTEGCIEGYGTRGGRVRMRRGRGAFREQEEMLAQAEGFEQDAVSAHFFPGGLTAADPDVDWKLLAMEYCEFGEAIAEGRDVEVDGTEGMKDVAAVYAVFESALAGRAVRMAEVESGEIDAYQAEIDTALGII